MISDHVNQTLDNLELQISSVEDELEELIKGDEDTKEKFDLVAVMRKMLVQLNAITRKELKRKEAEKALSPT